jgi:DNA modification methylase
MERCVRGLRSDGVVSIIVTDRKWKGTIVFKHQLLTTLLGDMGLELFLHKILVRNFGINMFRLGFSHILCFRRKERSGASRDTGRLSAEFRRDMWGPFASAGRGPSARNGFPPEVVKLLVESFTRPKDMVLDPFCGCGTTQRVALGMGRRAFGFETNPKLARFWSSIERPTKLGQRP